MTRLLPAFALSLLVGLAGLTGAATAQTPAGTAEQRALLAEAEATLQTLTTDPNLGTNFKSALARSRANPRGEKV